MDHNEANFQIKNDVVKTGGLMYKTSVKSMLLTLMKH